ncbi:MAG: hypothetical protein Q8J63_09685 [Candidatus Aquicultor sp.]|nr:hypothetical protein [Candidatus Aquicultor sp.]
MKCPQCGTEGEGKYCNNCGANMSDGGTPTPQPVAPPEAPPKKSSAKKKGCGCLLAAIAGLSLIMIVTSLGGGDGGNVNKDSATERNTTNEQPATEAQPQDVSIDEIYEQVSLGMTEAQVLEIAGESAMTSEVEMQGLGTVKNLVYYGDNNMDNITVSVQNGTVKVVVIGKFKDGKMTTKSKM